MSEHCDKCGQATWLYKTFTHCCEVVEQRSTEIDELKKQLTEAVNEL